MGHFLKQDAILDFQQDFQVWIMDNDSLENEKEVLFKWGNWTQMNLVISLH